MTDLSEVHTELYSPRDTLSREGAMEVGFLVREYWAKRGYDVRTSIEHEVALGRLGVYVVRSDMIGGFPREHPIQRVSAKQEGNRQCTLQPMSI